MRNRFVSAVLSVPVKFPGKDPVLLFGQAAGFHKYRFQSPVLDLSNEFRIAREQFSILSPGPEPGPVKNRFRYSVNGQGKPDTGMKRGHQPVIGTQFPLQVASNAKDGIAEGLVAKPEDQVFDVIVKMLLREDPRVQGIQDDGGLMHRLAGEGPDLIVFEHLIHVGQVREATIAAKCRARMSHVVYEQFPVDPGFHVFLRGKSPYRGNGILKAKFIQDQGIVRFCKYLQDIFLHILTGHDRYHLADACLDQADHVLEREARGQVLGEAQQRVKNLFRGE